MDFLLGSVTGFVCGFGLLYIQYHKSEVSHAILTVKDDISSLKNKLDQLLTSLYKP